MLNNAVSIYFADATLASAFCGPAVHRLQGARSRQLVSRGDGTVQGPLGESSAERGDSALQPSRGVAELGGLISWADTTHTANTGRLGIAFSDLNPLHLTNRD